VHRRSFLTGLALTPFGPGRLRDEDVFRLGVASGDPRPDGVVLWTRLAPDPLHPDPATPGGMPPRPVEVGWQVAEDERFTQVVAAGDTVARPELAHSVHADVVGLDPGREYFYRFQAGPALSPTGRTRTAPGPGALTPIRFAYASCQRYEHGHYTAHRHLAAEDLDVVLFLGDYIYEYRDRIRPAPGGNARPMRLPEPVDLAGYRLRYSLYKTDADLQAAHAAAPWIVTWDDHEVANDYRHHGDPAAFERRKAAAYQAYYEHLPLRAADVPRMYRRLSYGALADLHVLDTRQYRGSGDILGPAQEAWLTAGLAGSTARWQLLPQQVFFAPRRRPGGKVYTDSWDGYPRSRDRVLAALAARTSVLMSGDVHSNWAADLKLGGRTVAAELVGTSISSGGDGGDRWRTTGPLLAANPHLRFFDDHRGYVRCTLTAETLDADYRVVPYVRRPGAPVHTRASFRLTAGRPGLVRTADNPLPGAGIVPADPDS
jgi:alkaline phosphatase D